MSIFINKNYICLYLLLFIALFSEGTVGLYLTIPLILISMLLYSNEIIKLIPIMRNNKVCILLFGFVIFIFISFIFNFLFGIISVPKFLIAFAGGYLCHFILCFILGILFAYKNDAKQIEKFFLICLYLIIFAGLIEFLMYKFGLPGFEYINQLCSGREDCSNYKWSFFPRIQSFFAEPSHYAWFLVCNIPLVFGLTMSNRHLFKYKFQNKISLNLLMPLLFLSLILTQSAINIIIGIIVYLFCYFIFASKRSRIKLFIRTIILGFIFIIITCFLIQNNIPFINRILVTIPVVFSLKSLVFIEPSLATRIISYIHFVKVFLSHPLLGVAPGNVAPYFLKVLQSSNIPLTMELYNLAFYAEKVNLNPSIFFKIIAENGLMGICIFLLFIKQLYKTSINLKKIYSSEYKIFFKSISVSILAYCCLMFYDSQLYNHYFWILFGCLVGFNFRLKRNIEKESL